MVISSSFTCTGCGTLNPTQAAFCMACGQPTPTNQARSLTGLLVQDHLLKRRYRILQQIGKGGFGAVYQAADTHFNNRLVAIKEMSQSNLTTAEIAEATEAFKHETLLLAALHHPNLPRIYDHFNDAGRWYLVMDFIEGETIEDRLNNTPEHRLALDEVLAVGIQLCTVLDYLHTRQPAIIFRDLKPANIMRTPDGHLYLIDFGIARHFKPGQIKDTMPLGSPGYAPPEQYGKGQTTHRADIYSLGVTLHQCLSSHDPTITPFRLAPLPHNTSAREAQLAQLITRMTDLDEYKRPDSAAAIKQELQLIAQQKESNPRVLYATSQGPQGAPRIIHVAEGSTERGGQIQQQIEQIQEQKKRQRETAPQSALPRRTVLLGLGAAVVGGGALIGLGLAHQGNRPVPLQKVMKAVPTPLVQQAPADVSEYTGHSGGITGIAWSPDGQQLASTAYDNTLQIWGATTGLQTASYPLNNPTITGIDWSATNLIAYGSTASVINIINPATGARIFGYNAVTSQIQDAGSSPIAWSHDGAYLAAISCNETGKSVAQYWNVPQADPVNTYATNYLFSLAWSPDDTFIALTGFNTVLTWNVKTGNTTTFTGHTGAVRGVAWSPDSRSLATAGQDGTVRIWDAKTSQQIFLYGTAINPGFPFSDTVAGTGGFSSVAWSPDGKYLACGSDKGNILIFASLMNGPMNNAPLTYAVHTWPITSLRWSPNGKQLVSGCTVAGGTLPRPIDSTIRIIEPDFTAFTGKP